MGEKNTYMNVFCAFLLIHINFFQISPKIITIVDVGMQVGYAQYCSQYDVINM